MLTLGEISQTGQMLPDPSSRRHLEHRDLGKGEDGELMETVSVLEDGKVLEMGDDGGGTTI